MVAQLGAGIQPEIENPAKSIGAEIDFAAFVDESDDGNALFAERPQQLFRHGLDTSQSARAAVASAGKVVDGDGDPPVCRGGANGKGEQRQNAGVEVGHSSEYRSLFARQALYRAVERFEGRDARRESGAAANVG